jgi:aryl-alcohol dehydrogenase-like predicted oxidoreductase
VKRRALGTQGLEIAAIGLGCMSMSSQGDGIVPIPGTKRHERLEENVAALDVELSDDDLERIGAAFPKGATAGARYPDMASVNR